MGNHGNDSHDDDVAGQLESREHRLKKFLEQQLGRSGVYLLSVCSAIVLLGILCTVVAAVAYAQYLSLPRRRAVVVQKPVVTRLTRAANQSGQ